MKQVLLTLDGSKFAEAAIEPARVLAQALGARVHVLEVLKRPVLLSELLEVTDLSHLQMAERWDSRTEEVCAGINTIAHSLGEDAIAALRVGDNTVEEIIEYAVRNDIDYIVMATHGSTGLRGLVHGNVAAGVVQAGVAPVLLVRPAALDMQIEHTAGAATAAQH